MLPNALEDGGHVFLLRACAESRESWVCCIKGDMFEHATHVDDMALNPESGGIPNKSPKVKSLQRQVFDFEGEFNVEWWLRERQGPFFAAFRKEFEECPQRQSSTALKLTDVLRTTMLRLAVAANLLNFVATDDQIPSVENLDLLYIAATGPDIIISSRNFNAC